MKSIQRTTSTISSFIETPWQYPFRGNNGKGIWGPCGHTQPLLIDTNKLTLGQLLKNDGYATAADGLFANVLNTYREHLCSADSEWLKTIWPNVKKAMDWGIHHWDPDRDGYMQNTQHNTLDGAFSGCSSGSLAFIAFENLSST